MLNNILRNKIPFIRMIVCVNPLGRDSILHKFSAAEVYCKFLLIMRIKFVRVETQRGNNAYRIK